MKQFIDFELPNGFVDGNGEVHRIGRMRMAKALDEVLSLQDARVQGNEAFLPIILLSKVVVKLGTLASVTPQIIGQLYAADFLYLQDLYIRQNSLEKLTVETICPICENQIQLQTVPLV